VDNASIRVVLVEDNDVFREALELMLGVTPDIRVAAAVADGRAAVVACETTQPEVVLMDYRLPGLDGVETTRVLKEEVPHVAVVALTASANPEEMKQLEQAGAVACLTKDQDLDAIVAAIHEAAATVRA
jgi:DNA-binding NarL/FixJ family response regulator